MVVNPRHQDRWSGVHLEQGCRRLTSGFSKSAGNASFSGGFLRGLINLRMACVCRVARRVRPLGCGFVGGFSLELLVHRAALGMRTHSPDQRDPDGTGPRSVFGALPWRPVGRYGRAFGAR